MKAEEKKMPVLRFPEFENPWITVTIGHITTKVGSGSTPIGGEKVYTKTGIPFIRSQNVTDNGLSTEDISHIPEEIHNQMLATTVKPLDILLNITGASIGRVCVVPESFKIGNVNQHVCIIRLKSDYVPYYFQAQISSFIGQKKIMHTQTGSGREGLNFQSIRKFEFYCTSKPEQQKIADFLTAVDERIQQLSRKKELLEQYKKGVMQQLFSQQIRFKDDNGNDYPDWEEKRLGEVFDERTKRAGEYDYDLLAVSINDGVQLKSDTAKIDNSSSDKSKYKVVYKNDIVYNSMRMWQGASGVAKQSGITSPAYTVLAPKINVNSIFYSYYFKLASIIKLFERNSQGLTSDTWNLKYPALSDIVVLTTSSVEEQQRIADFLSSVDDKISGVQMEIKQSQLFKKGLLQQMFV